MNDTIMQDGRPIVALHFDRLSSIFVPEHASAIVPYLEGGQMGHVVWFRVIHPDGGGKVAQRVNAHSVAAIDYA